MNRLLLIGAAVLALNCGAAQAAPVPKTASVPKDFIGKWCFEADDGERQFYLPPDADCDRDTMLLTIKPKTYVDSGQVCRYTVVKTWIDHSLPRTTEVQGAPTVELNVRCTDEGEDICRWQGTVEMTLSKGTLIVKNHEGDDQDCMDE